MAGTLTISTLSDGTNSTSSTNCIQGSAKAWVNFNGSTQAIRSSYNVSSITLISTGQYRANFTTALPDTNYCFVGSTNEDTAGNPMFFSALNGLTKSTTQLSFYTVRLSGATSTSVQTNLAIFSS